MGGGYLYFIPLAHARQENHHDIYMLLLTRCDTSMPVLPIRALFSIGWESY